ncbi:MAG: hypothetical protein CVT62_02940 [Actinobacteria bacterium HGW-Actinobacteria-2]|nr:MAG: hypothetical protein CVT62_02940 [Actinobacteria bacterium HGW-Actinobacteria-2]
MKLGAIAATAVLALAPIVPTSAHADDDTADALAELFAMRADLLAERNQAIAINVAGIEAQHLAEIKALGYEPGTTDPREIARQMMTNKYNWGEDQFTCYNNIIVRESNWIVTADNPHSSAYGIPQALPGKKMASFGADWRTNAATQIAWGLWYVKDRYGTPCQAWSFKRAHGWY